MWGYQGVAEEGGIGIDINTLLVLCVKWVANENLLYRTGNSRQSLAVT